MIKKASISFLLFVVFSVVLKAQPTLQRSTLGSIGGSNTMEGVLIRQTIGQPYGTNTINSTDFNYRPGFQQPLFRIINIRQSIDVNIFPNPTTDEVNIVSSLLIQQARITLYDAAGKVIRLYEYEELKTCKIDCSSLPTGSYLLVISDSKSDLSTNKLIVSR